jgi:hypothetical protein
MSGIGLIFLILALVALIGGIYFAAWCMCAVQRNHKEGHYILESVEELDDLYNKKLYSGLGRNMVFFCMGMNWVCRFGTINISLLRASKHI